MDSMQYGLILLGAFVAQASPGPATLTIASAAMLQGRIASVAIALGVLTGSLFWTLCAGFGLGAVLAANVWLFEALRYLGAAYLLWLAYKSCRGAMSAKGEITLEKVSAGSFAKLYAKGLGLHLTNPKAILFLGALFSLGVPSTINTQELMTIIGFLFVQSAVINLGYAWLFSHGVMRNGYFRLKAWFDGIFAAFFALAAIKLIFSKLNI